MDLLLFESGFVFSTKCPPGVIRVAAVVPAPVAAAVATPVTPRVESRFASVAGGEAIETLRD